MNRVFIFVVLFCWNRGSAPADLRDWVEGSIKQNDGATRRYYNAAATLPWTNYMGDWRDAMNVEQGHVAYALTKVIDDDTVKPIEWDVTELVQEWSADIFPNQGMLLRVIDGEGPIIFASRESSDEMLHATLELSGVDGKAILQATADTSLTPSTYRSRGHLDQLRVSSEPEHSLVRFDLEHVTHLGEIDEATLKLHSTSQYGSASIGVFRCRQGHEDPRTEIVSGIARRYPGDRRIIDDPEVIFATGFERENWQDEWTYPHMKMCGRIL